MALSPHEAPYIKVIDGEPVLIKFTDGTSVWRQPVNDYRNDSPEGLQLTRDEVDGVRDEVEPKSQYVDGQQPDPEFVVRLAEALDILAQQPPTAA